MTQEMPHTIELPKPPRLVLRVGFAGNCDLPEGATDALRKALELVFETIARQLIEIAPGEPDHPERAARIARFFSSEKPLVRLITGLAEGADAIADQSLHQAAALPPLRDRFDAELAAVLPFDLASYRASRPGAFHAQFDEQAERCAYILTLDGVYDKPSPDTKLAASARARAYRSQSAFLLRQTDVLVATADPDAHGGAGGTMETAHAALQFELPVVFVHARTGQVWLIAPGENLGAELAESERDRGDWQSTLRLWIRNVVTGTGGEYALQSDLADEPDAQLQHHGEKLLDEFLFNDKVPRFKFHPDGTLTRKNTLRELLWKRFDQCFRPKGALKPGSDPQLAVFSHWRARATALNGHYSGLYRGAFVLNYVLAVVAVFMAALSLAILAGAHITSKPAATTSGPHSAAEEPGPAAAKRAETAPEAPPSTETLAKSKQAKPAELPVWLIVALAVLGLCKLVILIGILLNTNDANRGDWNDKAVDYRYLSERLRTMYYLPRIGSFQPPAVAVPQFVARAVRQSAAALRFHAIVRSSSPADLPSARRESILAPDGSTHGTAVVVRLDPIALLKDVRDSWVYQQSVYHDGVARTMAYMFRFTERCGSVLSNAVIAFVLADLVLLVLDRRRLVPGPWKHTALITTIVLLFCTALLPAAVASLNAIRFQSECRRLAERSAIMRTILRGRDQKYQLKSGRWAEADWLYEQMTRVPSDCWHLSRGGTGNLKVLHLAEKIAGDFGDEVSEWSVLYAKEVPEP